MGHQVIKQPNGKYALWSSVVEDFLMFDATPEDIIEFWLEREKEQHEQRMKKVIEELDRGDKPYYQFTKTWEEATAQSKERHGAKSAILWYEGGYKLEP